MAQVQMGLTERFTRLFRDSSQRTNTHTHVPEIFKGYEINCGTIHWQMTRVSVNTSLIIKILYQTSADMNFESLIKLCSFTPKLNCPSSPFLFMFLEVLLLHDATVFIIDFIDLLLAMGRERAEGIPSVACIYPGKVCALETLIYSMSLCGLIYIVHATL